MNDELETLILGLMNYIQNVRVAAYNEGYDAGKKFDPTPYYDQINKKLND